MADALLVRGRHENPKRAAAAIASGEIQQLPDGRAGVYTGLNAAVANDPANFATDGQFTVTKAASVVVLDGSQLWWDHSANAATPVPPTSDRDFYLGTAVGDATSAATTCTVNLNVQPQAIIDLQRDGGEVVPVLTAGTPFAIQRGGSLYLGFSATAEAQKLDWLSKRSFPKASNWILEALVEVSTNADADVADLNVGVANASHASDADSITESVFFHFDMGADLNLDAESDDGTTEVNATDTTIDWAVGTPIFLQIDGRDESNIKLYVNGVRVLSGTTFTLAAATGPLKLLLHLEKSANDSPGVVEIDLARVRIQE